MQLLLDRKGDEIQIIEKIVEAAAGNRERGYTYLIVDALDECVIGLSDLLEFISRMLSISPHTKWIISSRNWPKIEKYLDTAQKARLCFELNEKSISAAVAIYIEFKVDGLVKRNQYTTTILDTVQRYLSQNANDT
ncbi:hypothetical protein BKA66DRAFT_443980 [Pyrenochaeta sp. MPI-SDFR-AT-0127]|nr:hypothetical protein BKA66DRAFT_443980 [Pyrenochaeta sp. MPI-SDFR-AT-0127]